MRKNMYVVTRRCAAASAAVVSAVVLRRPTKEYTHPYSMIHRRLPTAGIEVAPHDHQLLVNQCQLRRAEQSLHFASIPTNFSIFIILRPRPRTYASTSPLLLLQLHQQQQLLSINIINSTNHHLQHAKLRILLQHLTSHAAYERSGGPPKRPAANRPCTISLITLRSPPSPHAHPLPLSLIHISEPTRPY